MPISNGTEERVGVEVSGPTAQTGLVGPLLVVAVAVIGTIAGWVLRSPALVAVSLALGVVGLVWLWRIRQAAKRSATQVLLQRKMGESLPLLKVLESGEKLDDPDAFHNLKVKFYKVDASDTVGAQIATIEFSTDDYTVTYHQKGDGSKDITPQKIVPEPIRIDLSKPSSGYKVSVQPEG